MLRRGGRGASPDVVGSKSRMVIGIDAINGHARFKIHDLLLCKAPLLAKRKNQRGKRGRLYKFGGGVSPVPELGFATTSTVVSFSKLVTVINHFPPEAISCSESDPTNSSLSIK